MLEQMQPLAEAVVAWVSYQIACGREHLLSEKLLCLPIVEFAQAQGWHVTLVVNLVAKPAQDSRCFAAGDDRESAQAPTSTISSEIAGGTDSPCLARLSR